MENMKQRNKLIIFVFCFLVFFIFIWQQIYLPLNSSDTEDRLFLIERGQNLFQISGNLEKQVIKDRFSFNLYVFLKGGAGRLQAGEYAFNPSMSIARIADKIISGDVAKETILIPEGWNLKDIAWYLENKGMFQAEELFELVGFPLIDYSHNSDLSELKDFSSDHDFLTDKPKNIGLEGYLFPDTYEIKRNSSLEEIVRKILDNFGKKLSGELREEIKRQEKTIFEIITIASLIEKEVKTPEEKKIVSGILWKRLKNKIPLQVDATINYITGKKTTKVLIQETKIDSPYNTYKYGGLPLGPICNPGIESIISALYPESSEYSYYLSTSEGETLFSKTLEEHNLKKAQYLK